MQYYSFYICINDVTEIIVTISNRTPLFRKESKLEFLFRENNLHLSQNYRNVAMHHT